MTPIWKLSKLTWILVKMTAPEPASRNVNIQCAFAIQSQAKNIRQLRVEIWFCVYPLNGKQNNRSL